MSFPEEEWDPRDSRKINADFFIDDRNVGGLQSWGATYQQLIGEPNQGSKTQAKPKKKWFFF